MTPRNLGCERMKTVFVENIENKQRVYDSLLLNPRHLGIFSSDLAIRIISELAKQPLCAMDVSKRLKENEQKIYYHLRKMKAAGIVKLNGTEQRYGMTAKIFQLVSPVIATKLYDEGYDANLLNHIKDPKIEEFLKPFVVDGKLNAKIIVGDPYPHGKFDMGARDGAHIIDLIFLMGKFVNDKSLISYKFDTNIDTSELKENLILFGEPKVNTIIDKINPKLPVYFDYEKGYEIVSNATGSAYDAPRTGIVIKCENPWNKNKKILIISGIGIRGVQASVIAITQYTNKLQENGSSITKIVEGLDKDGDGIIDDIRFLE